MTIQLQAAREYVNLCYIISSDYAHSFKGWKYVGNAQHVGALKVVGTSPFGLVIITLPKTKRS